jgi:hypothetical protein
MKKFLLHLADKPTPQIHQVRPLEAVMRYLDRYFRQPRHLASFA